MSNPLLFYFGTAFHLLCTPYKWIGMRFLIEAIPIHNNNNWSCQQKILSFGYNIWMTNIMSICMLFQRNTIVNFTSISSLSSSKCIYLELMLSRIDSNTANWSDCFCLLGIGNTAFSDQMLMIWDMIKIIYWWKKGKYSQPWCTNYIQPKESL